MTFDEHEYSRLVAALSFTHGIKEWDLYATGYYRAAEILVDNVASNELLYIDSLVYPIVYLYRQYLELRLKQLILKYRQFIGSEQDISRTHRLQHLWREFESVYRKAVRELPDEFRARGELRQVAACIKYFAEMDVTSETFRYPSHIVDENEPNALLNIGRIAQIMGNTRSVLDGCSIVLDVWDEIRDDAYAAEADLRAAEYEAEQEILAAAYSAGMPPFELDDNKEDDLRDTDFPF